MRRDKRFICLLAVLREKRSSMREKQTTYIYSTIYNTYTNTNKSECNATVTAYDRSAQTSSLRCVHTCFRIGTQCMCKLRQPQ